MKNIPKRIFLNLGEIEHSGVKDFKELSEITWSEERVFDSDIEYIRVTKTKAESPIEWEQRRYEIAKDAMNGLLASPIVDGINPNPSLKDVATLSIRLADALIEELKGGK